MARTRRTASFGMNDVMDTLSAASALEKILEAIALPGQSRSPFPWCCITSSSSEKRNSRVRATARGEPLRTTRDDIAAQDCVSVTTTSQPPRVWCTQLFRVDEPLSAINVSFESHIFSPSTALRCGTDITNMFKMRSQFDCHDGEYLQIGFLLSWGATLLVDPGFE